MPQQRPTEPTTRRNRHHNGMKAQHSFGRSRGAQPNGKTSNRSSTPEQGMERPEPVQIRSVKPPTRQGWAGAATEERTAWSPARPMHTCPWSPSVPTPSGRSLPFQSLLASKHTASAKAAATGPQYKHFSKQQIRNQLMTLYARLSGPAPAYRTPAHLTAQSLSQQTLPVISSPSPAEPSAPHPATASQKPAAPRLASQPQHNEHAPRPHEMQCLLQTRSNSSC